MAQPRNKPRVFLSYSKHDVEFINRLADDLRHCQIEPWLDSLDIRHGEPWLEAIFEGGISTCDTVLVYLTEHSITSPMVKKEIDAGLLQKLKDNRIAFLPYVLDAEIRSRLRPDIQSLQVPEWNADNYQIILPRVVAEIWRSYMDRTIASATNDERVKRLEAELQLERLKKEEGGIFLTSEQEDFAFIHKALSRSEEVLFATIKKVKPDKPETLEKFSFEVNVLSLLMALVDRGDAHFESHFVLWVVEQSLTDDLPDPKSLSKAVSLQCVKFPQIGNELLMFGLIQPVQETETAPFTSELRTIYQSVYTDKMNRFRYWLSFNNLMPSTIDIKARE